MEIQKVRKQMPSTGQMYEKCLFMGTQHFTEMTGKCTGEGHDRYCHNSRYFNFRTELCLSELTLQRFRYDFKTLKFKIAESSLQINVYSAVLQFVLPRFISSKTGPIVFNLRWENESCLNITSLKFPSLTNLV